MWNVNGWYSTAVKVKVLVFVAGNSLRQSRRLFWVISTLQLSESISCGSSRNNSRMWPILQVRLWVGNYVFLQFSEVPDRSYRSRRFWDIPSPWWQASTILVGVASGLSLLVGVTAAAACCVTYVVHTGTARAAGFMQLFAGTLQLRFSIQISSLRSVNVIFMKYF